MVQILFAFDRCVVAALWVTSGQNDAALVSGWEKHSIVNVMIVRIVDNKEPRTAVVGQPRFHLLDISVCSAQSPNVNEGLLCCFLTASVDPENPPEPVPALLEDKEYCVYAL